MCCFLKLSSEFVFPDRKPSNIDILYGLSRAAGQFGLFSFMCSFLTSSSHFRIILMHLILSFYVLFIYLFHIHMLLLNQSVTFYTILSNFSLCFLLLNLFVILILIYCFNEFFLFMNDFLLAYL